MQLRLIELANFVVILHSFASLVIFIVCIAMDHWIVTDEGNALGLFGFCFKETCLPFPEYLNQPPTMAIKAFLALSTIFNAASTITLVCAIVKKRLFAQRIGSGVLIFAGVCGSIGLAVFTSQFSNFTTVFEDASSSYSYCYVLGWLAVAICLLSGIAGFAFPFPN